MYPLASAGLDFVTTVEIILKAARFVGPGALRREWMPGNEFWDIAIARNPERYHSAMGEYREFLEQQARERERNLPPLEDETVMAARLVNTWLVGCDPEFVVVAKDGSIFNVAGVMGQRGVVGWDHNGHVVEIRPEPAHGTYAVVKRLQREILGNKTLAEIKGHKWRAGAALRARVRAGDGLADAQGQRLLTLGGHVHLDMPPGDHGGDPAAHEQRVEALDRITRQLEHLDILPSRECQTRRNDPTARRNGYGQFGDVRTAGGEREGGRTRMEYRTMASWLFHPKVAYICLTGAKLAAVSPATALETLRTTGNAWGNLERFFGYFKTKDSNARRACERLLEDQSVKGLQFDPDVDFKEKWGELGV